MAEPGIVFLMYHELELPSRHLCQSEPGYVRYILSLQTFLSQMNWLAQNGWRGLSVGETVGHSAENSVAITFDDGSETDLLAAAPILKDNGFKATFYVTAGFVGKDGYLSSAQVRGLHALGFEIGCHSMTHAYLDDLDEPALRREIVDSKKMLEDIVGANIEHFSCPGGRYNHRARNLVREAGYRSMATSRAHANSSDTDPYCLGRVAILSDTNTSAFERICTAEALRQMRLSETLRGAAKRAMGNNLYDRLRGLLLHKL
ncbi:MAG TPA: polysaccharide deacetylase family protein [Candidatus Sulfotelmatobacter sp.]|nr:polysaccharide deacetylase family protein [Candidatus Sulfotelmatobacter sp.]